MDQNELSAIGATHPTEEYVMFIRALLVSTALLVAAPVFAQDKADAPATATPVSVTDPAEFGAMASIANLFELESSTLAKERAIGEEVKAFADQMIADHTKAAQDMAPAAEAEGVTPATELDDRHQQILDDLAGLEGEEFDAAYIQAQTQAHDEAVALFEGYSTNGADGPLKEFATATLPTLKQHQEHVHGLAGH
jgi:putative membrane protein